MAKKEVKPNQSNPVLELEKEESQPNQSSDFDIFSIDNIVSAQSEDIKPLSLDENHIILNKMDVIPFLRVCAIESVLGNDVYSSSFYLELIDQSTINLVYNNGMVLVKTKIKTIITDKQILNPYIIDIKTMSKIVAMSSAQSPIIEKDGDLFAFMFGGKIFIETHKVNTASYKTPKESSDPENIYHLDAESFISLLSSLMPFVLSGSRAEERAIYFDDKNAYIYSGIGIGRFPGNFCNLTLQASDIEALTVFFNGSKGDLLVKVFPNEVEFSYGDSVILMPRKKIEISEEIKSRTFDITDGVKVDSNTIYTIVNVLDNIPTNSGIINIVQNENGFTIESPQRSNKTNSMFQVQASKVGTGLSGSVRLSIKALKSYMRSFKGNITIGVKKDKLFINSSIGDVMVAGSVVL